MLSFKPNKAKEDTTLVVNSLGGDQDAFCQIVQRYQTLLCSIAYASVGDVKLSEDLAQETFIEAWRKLDSLKEPQKLKAWLCGILRFKVSHFRRSDKRYLDDELIEATVEDTNTLHSKSMDDNAIDKQHQALLWKVLSGMDENYREPLILYYRQQQSVEQVAQQLDLSIDTAKQRLSRGRKLLHKSVAGLLESSLKGTMPSIAFTTAVMTVISTISPPASALAIGAGLSKASSSLKLSPFIVILASLSGLISAFFGLRAGLDQSRTAKEKRNLIKHVSIFMLTAAFFVLAMLVLKNIALDNPQYSYSLTIFAQVIVIGFAVTYIWLAIHMTRSSIRLRTMERIFAPEAFTDPAAKLGAKQGEYISPISIFGVPLIHMQFSSPERGYKPAFGWIAGGSYAYGLLFAWGNITVAPICVGIVSFGIVSIGAVGVGVFAIGTTAIGAIAFGASAIGVNAYSSLSSLAFNGALSGGFAVAHNAALGAVAFASHANTETAKVLVQLNAFEHNYQWVLVVMSILIIVPSAWYARKVKKRMR